MPNKIDRRLTPILKKIEKSRTLLAQEPMKNDENSFKLIKDGLDEIEKILRGIDTKRVLVLRKAGQLTDAIFEKELKRAIEKIDGTIGILYGINRIFNNHVSHSTEVLDLTRKIRENTLSMRRELKLVPRPLLRFLRSWKPVVVLLIVGLLGLAAVLFHRSEGGKPPIQAVTERLQKDTQDLRSAAVQTNGLDRIVKVTEQLGKMGQLVPTILVALASTLTALKGLGAASQAFRKK